MTKMQKKKWYDEKVTPSVALFFALVIVIMGILFIRIV